MIRGFLIFDLKENYLSMKKKDEGISLGEMLQILKKYFKIILSFIFLGVLISVITTFLIIKPKYTSSAELIVQAKDDKSSNLQSDINANVLLINTYKDMILGKMVLSEVSKDMKKEDGLEITPSELKNDIEVIQSTSSMVFQIQASSNSADEPAIIANKTALVFQKRASEVLDINKVTITSEAEVPESPSSPNKKLNIIIGLVIGLVIGIIMSFILDALDNTIKDEQFIKNELNLPIMGSFSELSIQEIYEGKAIIKSIRMKDTIKINDKKNHSETTSKTRSRERV